MNPRISLSDLVARLESADHTIAYFNTPVPEPLLDGMRLLAGRRGRGSLDLVVEQIDDVAYLKKLNFAGASVYNGVGLPRETLVIVDRIQGYWLATDTDAAGGALVAADNAPDLYVKLLWRRFGLAVSYEGELKEIYPDTGFFCVGLEERLDQVEQPDHGSLGAGSTRPHDLTFKGDYFWIGRNFGRLISGVTSSQATSTRMPISTSFGSIPITLVCMRTPSSSSMMAST